jgi:hypothetical protein
VVLAWATLRVHMGSKLAFLGRMPAKY